MLERAIKVAVVAHAGQVDKNGEAYIWHPLRVMLTVRERGGSVEQQAAAILRDVAGDCEVSSDFLAALSHQGLRSIHALTHQDGQDLFDVMNCERFRQTMSRHGACRTRGRRRDW